MHVTNDVYKVLLPRWIWDKATDNEHFKKLVLNYMQHYPHYDLQGIKDGFAICMRKEIENNGKVQTSSR